MNTATFEQTRKTLAGNPIFEMLAAADRDLVERSLTEVRYQAG